MSSVVRQSISQAAALEGVGLHSGTAVRVNFKPAEAGTGIVFARTDLAGAPRIGLQDVWQDGLPMRTTLKRGEAEVHTVEHLLAACAGLGVTDLLVELNGPEAPGMDGSALPFAEALLKAGLKKLEGKPLGPVAPRETVRVSEGEAEMTVEPLANGLHLTYTLHYPDAPLAQGTYELDVTPESFLKELAPARTFCLRREAETLRAAGFGKGATTQNTLVLDGAEVLENTLRFPDEPVRHKMLDLLGDLYVLGRPVRGRIRASRSGHKLNRMLAAELARNEAKGAGMELDLKAIQAILPHRYPFLLVDKIVSYEPGKGVVGLKNVTATEPWVPGHFPGQPIMPGVLILEALAQAGAVMVLKELKAEGRLIFFAGMDKVAFRRPVVPGDQLRLECEVDRIRPPFGRFNTRALVDGELAAEAVMKFMVQMPPKEGAAASGA
ncbi:MAG: UDP-3-O-[3-hydroxymyristoyl] N-acetylglucosamine deacetylase [Planctomycetes bacterium]|nr:UDP-3-O-[3-hydroxymyristoyl] N-acetylglucosamine deacetylase [Planctomycetota bacterium]